MADAGGELHRSTSRTVSPTCTRSPLRELRRLVHLLAVHERAVASTEIFDPERAVAVERARVHLRDERVERERHRAAAAAPERDSPSTGTRRPLRPRARRTHEAPRLAATARAWRGRRSATARGRAPARACPRSSRATIQHDPREEQVEQREEAELQEREDESDICPLRLLVADRGCTDDDHVAVVERVLLHHDAVDLRAVDRAEVDDTKPWSPRRISAWWRDTCGSESGTAQSGMRPIATGSSPSVDPAAVGEHQRARRARRRPRRSRRRREVARRPACSSATSATSTGPTKR